MENQSEVSGYVASTLVLLTFVAKDMRLLRIVAIVSNLAFIPYGTIEWLPPVPIPAPDAYAAEHCSTCGDRQGS